jgi:hypothetical protein
MHLLLEEKGASINYLCIEAGEPKRTDVEACVQREVTAADLILAQVPSPISYTIKCETFSDKTSVYH